MFDQSLLFHLSYTSLPPSVLPSFISLYLYHRIIMIIVHPHHPYSITSPTKISCDWYHLDQLLNNHQSICLCHPSSHHLTLHGHDIHRIINPSSEPPYQSINTIPSVILSHGGSIEVLLTFINHHRYIIIHASL